MTTEELIAQNKQLREALHAAQQHLEYCGYGRYTCNSQCAGDLDKQIEAALALPIP